MEESPDAQPGPRETWLRQCEAHLRLLRPSLSAHDAEVVALLAFGSAADLVPEDAAAVYAEVLAAGVPVGDLKRWMKAAAAGGADAGG
jgi:hypothetical protein